MATIIYRLYGVDEGEAQEVRELLDAHQVDYYETSGGNWGVSVAALWLRDEERLEEVKGLLVEYGEQRAAAVREAAGESPQGVWQRFREAPLQTLMYLLGALLIFYLSLLPFMGW